MRLDEFGRTSSKAGARYAGQVAEGHELVIVGPDDLITEAFREANFEVAISPGIKREEWSRQGVELLRTRADHSRDVVDVEDRAAFAKEPAPPADPGESVFVALRKTTPGGTGYWLSVPLFVPTGRSIFFILPPVCVCGGIVMPGTGDEDLFLTLNGTGPPTVAASVLGGTAWDRVSFSARTCWPWDDFIPFFRVFGFVGGVCVFGWGGFAVLP